MVTSTEQQFERFWIALGDGDFDTAVSLYAADATIDFGDLKLAGRAAVRQHMESFRRGFPDARYTVHRHQEIGDGLILEEWTCEGTHDGEFARRPASGTNIQFRAVSFYEMEDGKVRSERTYVDLLNTMVAIGALEWAKAPQA